MKSKKSNALSKQNLTLEVIEPLTANQRKVWDANENILMCGTAGSGKTFLACYIALDDIFKNEYKKLVIVRSAVPTRDMGFLPGSDKDKANVYESPYIGVFSELFNCGTAYESLKASGTVEFKTTSFVRGITISDAVIIVDEMQNLSFHELDSIITRVGQNCKIIFCGDFNQADLAKNGMKKFVEILRDMRQFDIVEFGIEDIVRSGLVKDYLIAKAKNESSFIK